jgi:NADH:ubiquinone oxidoreductase subunit 5 (subunit L)/multisubunit Na+/H+ antiporter MnhA subunit
MGGLAKRMPLTALAFAIGAIALSGLPITLALPPKDAVLAAAWQANGALFVAALVASLFTALYSARIFGLVFLGVPSQPAQQAHEAKKGLLLPLLILAILIPLGLLANAMLLGQPLARLLGVSTPDVTTVTLLALFIAVIGVAAGLAARLAWPASVVWPPLKGVTPLFAGEFGLQAGYRLLTRLAFIVIHGLGTFDRLVFDTLTDDLVKVTLALVRASGRFDVQRLDAAIRKLGQDILALSQRVRALQTGRIDNYLLAVFVWSLGVIAVAIVAAFMH